MKLIPLSRGLFAKVDDKDYARVSQFKWHATKGTRGEACYAVRNVLIDGKRTLLRMHVFIMNTPPGHETHHKNNDGLDNQQENLQVLTPAEHKRFRICRKDNTSGFRGVVWKKDKCLWRAEITVGGKNKFIEYCKTAKEAATARDSKARQLGWPEEGMNFSRE